MTAKPTTDELFAKLGALDVEILYFGDDRKLQGSWLEEDAWVERVPWGDGEQQDIRCATDAEIIRALAAVLLHVATDVEANRAHTALGHAVAKVCQLHPTNFLSRHRRPPWPTSLFHPPRSSHLLNIAASRFSTPYPAPYGAPSHGRSYVRA